MVSPTLPPPPPPPPPPNTLKQYKQILYVQKNSIKVLTDNLNNKNKPLDNLSSYFLTISSDTNTTINSIAIKRKSIVKYVLTLYRIALQICYTSVTASLRRNSTKFTNFWQIIHDVRVNAFHLYIALTLSNIYR